RTAGSCWQIFTRKKPALAGAPEPAPVYSAISRYGRSEVDLRAELVSARIGSYTARLPEVGVGLSVGLQAGVVAGKIDVIQRVEDVESQPNLRRGSSERRQVLPETHIEILVRERARNGKTSSLEHRAETLAAGVQCVFPAQRQQSRPLKSERPRHVRYPVRD